MKKVIVMTLLVSFIALSTAQSDTATCKDGREVSTKTEHYCLVTMDGKEVKHGVYKAMQPNGSPKIEGAYSNGMKTGTWTYWSRNGKKIEVTEYVDDKKSGLSQAWSANSGKLIYKGEYKDGKSIGTHRKWYDDGKKLSEVVFTQEGQNTKMESIHWHVNGQKKMHYLYINGKHDGKYERWFMDGKPQELGTYKNGKRVGEWKKWNNKGKETVRTY